MKRFVRVTFSLLALAVVIALGSLPVQARWVQKEVKWQISYQGGSATGTNIVVHDTTYAVFGGGTTTLDTTMGFSLDDADVPPRGSVGPDLNGISGNQSGGVAAYQSDTTILGYLVFQADSTAAPTATMTSVTFKLDGRVGSFGPSPAVALSRGWVAQDSIVVDGRAARNLTAADESIAIPIRTIGVYGNIRKWAELRGRTTAATGILSAARVFIRYWKADARPN
jgi:hypothetical protein